MIKWLVIVGFSMLIGNLLGYLKGYDRGFSDGRGAKSKNEGDK